MIRSIALAAMSLCALWGAQEVFGRGFGGGYRGGGYHGGEMGGFHGEEMHGYGGREEGGYRGGENPSRSDMNRFLGMPSDGGMHAVSSSHSADGYTVDRGAVEGPRGGVAAGASVTGPRGNTADRGVAEGPRGGVTAGDSVTGARGNTLQRGAAVGPNGGEVAGRSAVGAEGGRVTQGVAAGPAGGVAAAGVARGPEGAVAGRGVAADHDGAVAGFGYASPSARYGQAYGVRAGFTGTGLYTPAWYGAHPGAWSAGGLTTAAWTGANWTSLSGWFGPAAYPVDYNYGSNIVAQGNNVYVDGQDVGTTQAYYQQAANLAQTGAAAPPTDQNWLPLGVFVMARGDHTNANMVIQLAVNKQGVIRGNFTDTQTNQTLPVQGAIDKQTQRAAFTIGDKRNDVIDTGMYNLTKDEVPVLLHVGQDRTESWMLVRVKQNAPQPG